MIRRRKPIPPKRKKRRANRPVDHAYLAFIAAQPCMVTGLRPVTVHHVRRHGEARNDRRTVPLIAERHLIQFGPHFSVEAMGRERFQVHFGIDFEKAIVSYNSLYDSLTKGSSGGSDT